jgi:hypothetical protein
MQSANKKLYSFTLLLTFFFITAKIYFKRNPSTRSAKGNPQEYIKKGAKAHRH